VIDEPALSVEQTLASVIGHTFWCQSAFAPQLIAVGIPIAWNSTVRKKTEAWLAATPDREPEWLQLQREHEQIAIQVCGSVRFGRRVSSGQASVGARW